MRTNVLLTLLAAAVLAVPAGALASRDGHGPKKATYELHGTLSAYTAAVGATPGSITILVSKANKAGRPFVGLALTFPVSSTTKVQPTGAVIANGDRGSVQVKGARGLSTPGPSCLGPGGLPDADDRDEAWVVPDRVEVRVLRCGLCNPLRVELVGALEVGDTCLVVSVADLEAGRVEVALPLVGTPFDCGPDQPSRLIDVALLGVGERRDRKSTRLNSSHSRASRMPSSA